MSRFIKTCRQYVQFEWDNQRLYPTYPNMSHVLSVTDMQSLLVKADTTANQMGKFNQLLEKAGDIMPFASTIHNFLRKYDTTWYHNEYAGRDA
jgi:hypothetical protein